VSVYMMLQVPESGATEQPQVTFWHRLNAPDEF
jgi:hypothetical protein